MICYIDQLSTELRISRILNTKIKKKCGALMLINKLRSLLVHDYDMSHSEIVKIIEQLDDAYVGELNVDGTDVDFNVTIGNDSFTVSGYVTAWDSFGEGPYVCHFPTDIQITDVESDNEHVENYILY